MIYFERKEYLNKLISAEGNWMIKIITGIRRCGKFFLLFNFIQQSLGIRRKSFNQPQAYSTNPFNFF